VAAHEIIHEIARKKEAGIVLKLDYEKAYDRVNWDFLVEVLTSRGFSKTWIDWIINLTRGGSICVRLNDVNGPYFTVGKGLRQGDPLSPLLFNLVVDVFTKMLTKACTQGLISGLLTNVVEGGIVSLQYADDTILWSFADSNSFSVQAVYKTISFRGVQPAYTPSIWKLSVPPRIHIFLWLLYNNKILTRTNLAKRRHVEDQS